MAMQENEYTKGADEQEIDIDYVYGRDDCGGTVSEPPVIGGAAQTENGSVVLEEMRGYKNSSAGSIKAMMLADDLAMEIGKRPKLENISDEYADEKNRRTDISQKDFLDRREKEEMKARLREEMESKPEGYSQAHSRAIYHKFIDEQQADDSRRGFMILLLMTAMGVSVAALTYFLKLNRDGTRPYMNFLPIATVLFSLFMLIKSKFCKIVSAVYFFLNTIVLIGPGLVVFARTSANQIMEDYILKLILYVLTILCSVLVAVQVASNKTVAVYYSYSPPKDRKY